MLIICFISTSQTLYTLCTSSPFRCKPVRGHDPTCWRLDWKDIFNAWDPFLLQTESYLRPWTHWKRCKLELFRIDCLLKWFQQWKKSTALFFYSLFFRVRDPIRLSERLHADCFHCRCCWSEARLCCGDSQQDALITQSIFKCFLGTPHFQMEAEEEPRWMWYYRVMVMSCVHTLADFRVARRVSWGSWESLRAADKTVPRAVIFGRGGNSGKQRDATSTSR